MIRNIHNFVPQSPFLRDMLGGLTAAEPVTALGVHPESSMVAIGDPRGVVAVHSILFRPVKQEAGTVRAAKVAGIRRRVTPELTYIRCKKP